jgi:hypothetical protein
MPLNHPQSNPALALRLESTPAAGRSEPRVERASSARFGLPSLRSTLVIHMITDGPTGPPVKLETKGAEMLSVAPFQFLKSLLTSGVTCFVKFSTAGACRDSFNQRRNKCQQQLTTHH